MEKYNNSIKKAVKWLKDHQNDNGSINPLEAGIGSYYKMPLAFLAAGEPNSAWKLLSWIKENVQDKTGDFTGPYERGIYTGVYPYSNAWLTIAAHLTGFFDISIPGVKFLKSIQSNEGGFYKDIEIIKKASTNSGSSYESFDNALITYDIMCTAMAGLACLYTGNAEEAVITGSLFEQMYNEQPDLTKGFYFHYQAGQGLYRDFSDDSALAYYIDFSKEKQFYFELGIAAVFLTRLGQYLNQTKFIDLAEKYLQLINNAASDKFTTPQSGKIGWAASYLYNLTGKETYKDMVEKVANYLLSAQDDSGCWYNVSEEKDLKVTTLDVTAEFVVLLHEMLSALE